jgi:hypothetical protein
MLPIKTGTDGALVVPLTRRWNPKAAPEQSKKAVVMAPPILGSVESIPIYPTMETGPVSSPTSQKPTAINPLDFMRGNPYE